MSVTERLGLQSGTIYKKYTAAGIAADVDLSVDFPGYGARQGKLPRSIEYAGGDLVVKDTQGNVTTLPAANAAERSMVPRWIVDVGTTATFILVIW